MANEVHQAAYLKAVYDAAIALYREGQNKKPYPFAVDLLGRVIVRVPVQKTQYENLGHPIQNTVTVSLDLATPQKASDEERLLPADDFFIQALKENALTKEEMEAFHQIPKSSIISLGQETYFHAHLIGRMLKAAAIKADKPINEVRFQAGLNATLLALNERIIQLQAQAIKEAYRQSSKKGRPIDLDKFKQTLNKELDKARKELPPHIAKTIKEELKKQKIKFPRSITRHLTKELAKATSAIADDYVHIDKSTGSISFIGASEYTSHHQELGGGHTASRIIYTHHFAKDGAVTPLSHRQHVRVPSLALRKIHKLTQKLLERAQYTQTEPEDTIRAMLASAAPNKQCTEEEITQISGEYNAVMQAIFESTKNDAKPTSKQIKAAIKQAIINDTTEKIKALQARYGLAGGKRYDTDRGVIDEQRPRNQMPKAFIYNLYTTLNKNNLFGMIDERSNKQSQSAEYILAAAHQYNRNNPGEPLCLVLNMAVNGWGHELTIRDSNPDLVNEAALMAQMATLHTVHEVISTDNAGSDFISNTLFERYKDFLSDSKEPSFYLYLKKHKKHNQQLLTLLKTKQEDNTSYISKPLENCKEIQDPEPRHAGFTHNAKIALLKLYKEGAWSHHENGFTYQALSVFVADASAGGCKSANERTQAVLGRLAILYFVSLPKAERDKILASYITNEEELDELKGLADNLEDAIFEANTANITRFLNALYDRLNLEGFQAAVSFIDQGAHSKLGTKGGLLPNTNNAEYVEVRVHAKYAADGQSHNGLFTNILEVFCRIKALEPLKILQNAVKDAVPDIALMSKIGIPVLLTLALASFAFPPLGGALLTIAFAIGMAVAATTALLVMKNMVGEFLDSKKEPDWSEEEEDEEDEEEAHHCASQAPHEEKEEEKAHHYGSLARSKPASTAHGAGAGAGAGAEVVAEAGVRV